MFIFNFPFPLTSSPTKTEYLARAPSLSFVRVFKFLYFCSLLCSNFILICTFSSPSLCLHFYFYLYNNFKKSYFSPQPQAHSLRFWFFIFIKKGWVEKSKSNRIWFDWVGLQVNKKKKKRGKSKRLSTKVIIIRK